MLGIGADVQELVSLRVRRRHKALQRIALLLLAIVAYHVMAHHIGVTLAATGLGAGAGLGLLMGRMHIYSWDPVAKQVISRMDFLGALLLTLYIAAIVGRRLLLVDWVPAEAIAAVSLAFAGGSLLGRSVAARRRVYATIATLRSSDGTGSDRTAAGAAC